MGAEQDLQSVPGVASQPDPATKEFIFQQVRFMPFPDFCNEHQLHWATPDE
jgi:hypothetical protein